MDGKKEISTKYKPHMYKRENPSIGHGNRSLCCYESLKSLCATVCKDHKADTLQFGLRFCTWVSKKKNKQTNKQRDQGNWVIYTTMVLYLLLYILM